MKNFFRGLNLDGKTVEVKNGETLSLGKHELQKLLRVATVEIENGGDTG